MRNRGTIGWAALAILLLPWVARAGDGVAAPQTAAPSCADGSGAIYVDCSNGTVTDNRSGLVWLARADCFNNVSWHDAMKFVAGLADLPDTSVASADDCGLSDGSSAGEWRLPSTAEWEVMVADAEALGCDPTITDDQGSACWVPPPLPCEGCSFSGVESASYWSTATDVSDPADARLMALFDGDLGTRRKTSSSHAWQVRGGQ